MEIYQPAEDSYFFADFLKKYLTTNYSLPTTHYLDMGSGSGILSETASKFLDKKNILATDINSSAIKLLKQKKINAIKTNLFEIFGRTSRASQIPNPKSLVAPLPCPTNPKYQIPNPSLANPKSRIPNPSSMSQIPRFDLITFNAPYLPLDSREPKSSQLATTGGKKGDEISLEFLKQAKKHLNKNGKIFLLISSLTPMDKIKRFNPKIVAKKKIFMEELLILEFS